MVDLRTANSSASTRPSRHINRKPATNIYHAVRLAEVIGTPLTHLITINFSKTTCLANVASTAWQRLLARHFTPWIRRPPKGHTATTSEPAYVWVLENSGDLGLHWLVHVPHQRLADLEAKLPGWLSTVGATLTEPAAIDVRAATNPRGAAYYLLKGTNPVYAAGLGVQAISQGEVVGKRSGFSRSLGPSRKLALRAVGQYSRRRYLSWPPTPRP